MMKQIKVLFVFAGIVCSLVPSSRAQITVSQSQASNWYSPGSSFRVYQDTTTATVNVGKRGGPNVYDFSSLPFYFAGRETVFTVSQIPQLASRYNSSARVFRFDQVPGETEYLVFELADQLWKNFGDATLSASGTHRYEVYAPYDIDMRFPVTYGSATTHSFTSLQETYVNGVRTQSNTAAIAETLIVDGFGTLKLPGYSLNCLRIRKREYQGGNYQGFLYLTQEGASLSVNSRSSQPDTGSIQVEGVFYILAGPLSTVTRLNSQPEGFYLAQNYPNPFNPSTTIRFGLATPTHVTLTVYNFLGQEVETLVNEKLSAGEFEVKWNAADHPTGMYFYRLHAGDVAKMNKLMLLK